MLWLSRIINWIPLLVAVVILLWLLRQDLSNGLARKESLKKAIIIVLVVNLLAILFQLGKFYIALKNDPMGVYLLPGKGNNYFFYSSWNLFEPLVLAIAAGALMVLVGLIIAKVSRRPMFLESDFYVFFLTSLIIGYPNFLVLFLGGLLLMVIFKIAGQLIFKQNQIQSRTRIAPFLYLVAILIIILSQFTFYQFFLNRLGII